MLPRLIVGAFTAVLRVVVTSFGWFQRWDSNPRTPLVFEVALATELTLKITTFEVSNLKIVVKWIMRI